MINCHWNIILSTKQKYMKKIIFWLCLISCVLCLSSQADAYLFGFKSRDNSISNIQQIEEQYGFRLPIVSFIFDPYWDHVVSTIKKLPSTLWIDRIYHISLSPNSYTAQQVADGLFDKQYKQFFALIKSGDVKVIFRTMHEFNWGRYPRSSNPSAFKKARIHVRNLSREAGLSSKDILFDFSLNARDLPAKNGKPAQTATFIHCTQAAKAKLKCPTFEDYYPGDQYVDLMWVTFYNRGKWNSNRRRGDPRSIVNAKWRNTLDRMKKYQKPIFIDEVATTAVNYEWAYNFQKSLEVYRTNSTLKNERLRQFRDFLKSEPSIIGANYFNVDLTNGLQNRTLGELDWSAIDLASNKFYEWIMDLINAWEKLEKNTSVLVNVFNIRYLSLSGTQMFVPSQYYKPIQDLYKNILSGSVSVSTALQSLADGWLQKLYRRFNVKDAQAMVEILRKVFEMQKINNKTNK